MSTAERPFGQETKAVKSKKILRGWIIGTTLAGGICGGSVLASIHSQPVPHQPECTDLKKKVDTLETTLIKDGTLSDEGPLARIHEIRVPNDSRVLEWGQMKNTRDKTCRLADDEENNSWHPLAKLTAVLGAIGVIIGLKQVSYFREVVRGQRILD